MKLALIFNVFLSVGVFGDGEMVVVSKPPNVEFRGHEECDSYIVRDICSSSLGFTTYPTSDWRGMCITSPFNFAESVIVISVHGVPSVSISDSHKFPYVADSPSDGIWSTLESKILERYPDGQDLVELDFDAGVNACEINLNKGELKVKRPSVKFLKEEEDDDASFISQIAIWRAVLDKFEEKGVPVDGLPDLYWFNLRGLHPIVDIYGENSDPAVEARSLVLSTISQTKEVLEKAYNNKTLILVLSSDVAHTRRYRRATNQEELISDLKLAPVYDENYPIFFNIFLWFTIAFIMTIIATSMVTACMDPGRDSIIYRMTSTRMKKDN